MSAFTSRNLYDMYDEEEDDIGFMPTTVTPATSTPPPVPGQVTNNSKQTIIVVLYRKVDTFQVSHVEKKKISPMSSKIFDRLRVHADSSKVFNMHIHFPGIMGMISPRTMLSAGFGFKVHAGDSYSVSMLSKKDAKGNKCAVFRVNAAGHQDALESKVYHFGDMVLRPGVRIAKRAYKFTSLALKPAMFTEYLLRRRSNHGEDRGSNSAIVNAGGNQSDLEGFDDLEVWGMFFDNICATGISLCRNNKISCTYDDENDNKSASSSNKEDVAESEYTKDVPWITSDDIELQEPYLFIGLPACTLFTVIFRSFSDVDGIVLGDSRRVTLENCPDGFKEMLEMLLVTKTSLLELESGGAEEARLKERDILWMQQFLLYSSSQQEMTVPPAERQTEFRHALSHLIGVCIQLTQQPYFKDNFLTVLEEISYHIDSAK